jgi:hypothetical protein
MPCYLIANRMEREQTSIEKAGKQTHAEEQCRTLHEARVEQASQDKAAKGKRTMNGACNKENMLVSVKSCPGDTDKPKVQTRRQLSTKEERSKDGAHKNSASISTHCKDKACTGTHQTRGDTALHESKAMYRTAEQCALSAHNKQASSMCLGYLRCREQQGREKPSDRDKLVYTKIEPVAYRKPYSCFDL